MTVVVDHVRRIDAQLDQIHLEGRDISTDDLDVHAAADVFSSSRVNELLQVARALSTTYSSSSVLPSWRIEQLLTQSGLARLEDEVTEESAAPATDDENAEAKNPYETQIEWLLVSKATIQVYGLVLNTLLDEIIPINDDIWYWDEILSSNRYIGLYTIQTSPLRLWDMTKQVYQDSRRRFIGRAACLTSEDGPQRAESLGLSQWWRQFYGIVRASMRDRSLADIQKQVLSPIALCRTEARRKQARLKRLREMMASGLGVLVDEALMFDMDDGKPESRDEGGQAWRGVVEKSVALMDMVLQDVSSLDTDVADFEDRVFAGVAEDPELSAQAEGLEGHKPRILARRLLGLLKSSLPESSSALRSLTRANGRPPALVRYWLPVGLALVSSTAVARFLVGKREEIVGWITNLGHTVLDFWANWVVDPVRKVIRTIRHDEASEIAIMSRESLRADRESLERMVVDFAIDKPHFVDSMASLSEAQIAEVRAKVGEGDVTPVLRAFEKDLRSPFLGAVRGDLVRSLLIQVQKTKVDLEVALSGIDSLLRSQELVFGFVGLTPGLLVTASAVEYARTALSGGRRGRHGKRTTRCVRELRNIDRLFSEATPSETNVLRYKDHGLLVCHVHSLRNLARGMMPADVEKEFLEDLNELANVKGIQIQEKALQRIRWAYSRWLQ